VTNFHELKDYVLEMMVISSALHSILPPWDWDAAFLADFPWAQRLILNFVRNRWYKLAIYGIGYVAVNIRSTLWKNTISMPVQFQKMKNGG